MPKIQPEKSFLEELRKEFQPLRRKILAHPFVASVENGKASREKLKYFVKQQFHIINGDFRNLALYIAFSPTQWIRDFFLELINGESSALYNLFKLAKAVGVDAKRLESSEPDAGSLAFTNYFTRLATYGTAGEIASALIIDFEVWGENCNKLSKGLKKHYQLTSEDTRFLEGFYPINPKFYDNVMKIIGDFVTKEKERIKMRTAARLGLDYELIFWNTIHKHR
jgi:thiaminase